MIIMSIMIRKPPPTSLYIHIPWCVKKCPYCDFNSHALKTELPESDYIQQLMIDLDQICTEVGDRPIRSVFFGGGTPSLFSPKSIGQIIERSQKRLNFESNVEITMETNPGTVEYHRFSDYRLAGVNRISLGAQSFQDEKLEKLGRIHQAADLEMAIEKMVRAGFHNFNLDIMYGLPEQTLEDALYDLERAVAFSPSHLSWYHLTMEPNTAFYKNPPALPKDDAVFDMQQRGQAFLKSSGFEQYEVSAYAKNGQICTHNTHYWEFGDYIGIGAGAHGKITCVETQTITRHQKYPHPKDYLKAITKTFKSQRLSSQALPFEFMLNALRLTQGVPWRLFEERTFLPQSVLEERRRGLVTTGLLVDDEHQLKTTEQGFRFLNDVMMAFLD